jgi:peptidoglycan/LPS O-acetylase OafA/YrhL
MTAAPLKERIAALDVLRLAAALWVLAWHFFFSSVHVKHYIGIRTAALEGLSHYGFLGVQVFFVISGFVISMSMQGRTAREFLLARCIRLYPAYWICLAITLMALSAWGTGLFGCNAACTAMNATMLGGFFGYPFIDPSYWSLAAELQFYAMIALLMFLRLTQHLFVFVLAWLLLSASAFVANDLPGLSSVYSASAAMWAPYFGAGVVVFLMRTHGPKPKYWLGLVLCWLLALKYIGVDVASFAGISVPGHPFSQLAGTASFTAFLGVILLIGLRLISLRPSRCTELCGGTSYTLYLLHQVLGITLLNRFRGLLPDAALMGLALLLVFAMSILVWRYAELPLQRKLRCALLPRSRSAVPGTSSARLP